MVNLDNTLLHALLVACDQSYNPNPIQDQPLDPYEDSNNGNPDPAAILMPAAWRDNGDLAGWNEYQNYADPQTGFGYVIYQKETAIIGQYDYIVALRGTRGPNSQDWINNLSYGWNSWAADSGGQKLMEALNAPIFKNSINTINFTGQSLGGALAQYAAYEFEDQTGFNRANLSLTTFNGLGGVQALKDNYEKVFHKAFDPTLLGAAAIANYWITNDLVSELGGGHLGGPSTEYNLNFLAPVDPNNPQTIAPDGKPWALSITDAHRIETGFYAGFNRNPGLDFTTFAKRASPPPFNSPDAAAAASTLANLFNSPSQISSGPEAWVELAMGGTLGVFTSPIQSAQLLAEIWRHQGMAGQNFTPEAATVSVQLLRQGGTGANQIEIAALGAMRLLTLPNAQTLAWQDNVNLQALVKEEFLLTTAQNQGGVASIIQTLSDLLPDVANAASLEIASGVNNGPYAFDYAVAQAAYDFLTKRSAQSADDIRQVLLLKEAIFEAVLGDTQSPFKDTAALYVRDQAAQLLNIADTSTVGAKDMLAAINNNLGQWAQDHGVDPGTTLGGLVQGLFSFISGTAHAAIPDTANANVQLAQSLAGTLQDLLKSAANDFTSFTNDYTAPSIDWLSNLTDGARRLLIQEVAQLFGGNNTSFTGIDPNQLLASLDSGLAQAVSFGVEGAQSVAIVAGTGPNPFVNDLGFDPSARWLAAA